MAIPHKQMFFSEEAYSFNTKRKTNRFSQNNEILLDQTAAETKIYLLLLRVAFADREKDRKSLVSGGGTGGGSDGRGSGGSKGGGSGNDSSAGQSPYPLQTCRNRSNSLCLESHFSRK